MASSSTVAPSDRNRVTGRAASVVATTIALVTVVGFAREIGLSFERSFPPWIVGLGLVGTVAIAAGAWATSGWHPEVSIGLAVASVGFFVPVWAAWPSLPNAVRAASLAAAPFAIAGICRVGLGWANRARNGRILWTIDVLVISAAIVHLLAYDAFADPGCDRTCLHADPIAGQLLSTGSAITITAALSIAAAGLGAAAIMVSARRSNSRLVTVSVLVALAAIAVDSALAASWIGRSERWGELAPAVAEFAIEAAAVAMLGVGVLAAVLAVRRTRVAIDRVVAPSPPRPALRGPRPAHARRAAPRPAIAGTPCPDHATRRSVSHQSATIASGSPATAPSVHCFCSGRYGPSASGRRCRPRCSTASTSRTLAARTPPSPPTRATTTTTASVASSAGGQPRSDSTAPRSSIAASSTSRRSLPSRPLLAELLPA